MAARRDRFGNPVIPRLTLVDTDWGPNYIVSPPRHLGTARRFFSVGSDPAKAYANAVRHLNRVIPDEFRRTRQSLRARVARGGLTGLQASGSRCGEVQGFRALDPDDGRPRYVYFWTGELGWDGALRTAVRHRLEVIRRDFGPMALPSEADWVCFLSWAYQRYGMQPLGGPLLPEQVDWKPDGADWVVAVAGNERRFPDETFWYVRAASWALRRLMSRCSRD